MTARPDPTSRGTEHGVVVLAMGGPARPEEVEPFLYRLFSDPAILQAPLGPLRRPLARVIARLRAPGARLRYGLVGGSPLVSETEAQVRALAEALAGDGWPVAAAYAYSEPGPAAVVARLAAAGVRRLVALPMYPQRSAATTDAALAGLRVAARASELGVLEVTDYPTLPGLITPLADQARAAIARLQVAGRSPAVLLTAHGLPERYLRAGDPYVTQVRSSADAFCRAAALACPVALGFQSRLGPVRWVGPAVEDEVVRLAHLGIRELVVVPLTFVCEHLETRYDLDLALRAHAWSAGIVSFERVPAVGTAPAFVAGLADLVRARVREGAR
jgi:protoporphyrin/coproporphyrin ferrochelatase